MMFLAVSVWKLGLAIQFALCVRVTAIKMSFHSELHTATSNITVMLTMNVVTSMLPKYVKCSF